MLAAASPRPNDMLGTVRLALLLESKGQDLNKTLKEYLIHSLEGALAIIDRPQENAKTAKPEAVLLAISLLTSTEARDAVDALIKKENSSESADLLLRNLENYSDASGQSSYFGREIHTVI